MSQVVPYRGSEGVSVKMPFMKRASNGWHPKGCPDGGMISADRADLAVLMAL